MPRTRRRPPMRRNHQPPESEASYQIAPSGERFMRNVGLAIFGLGVVAALLCVGITLLAFVLMR